MTETKTPTIEDALLALHSVDQDEARIRNAVGFNGRDTRFGNDLARQVRAGRTLSDRQRAAAFKMLKTYKVQLLRDHGIDLERIEAPTVEAQRKATGKAFVVHPEAESPTVLVRFDGYPGDLLAAVKHIPGARYSREDRTWRFKLTPQTAMYVAAWPKAIERGPSVDEALSRIEAKAATSAEASRAVEADIDLPYARDLYGFQRAGIAYAVEHGRTLIADEMGLGKTVQALSTVELQNAYPVLVVVPAVVKLNWLREARRWIPGRTVQVAEGRKPRTITADILVINYDILPYWTEEVRKHGWNAVIFDESHYLKNAKAKRTKAAKTIAHTIPLRLLLTGTPVLNRPVELTSQLDVLGRLDDFGGFWTFVQRYCAATKNPWGWDFTGASNLEELHAKLRETCFVRRTKAQVLGDLPAKQKITMPVEFDRTHYEEVERDLKVWLKERILADEEWRRRLSTMADEDIEAARLAFHKEQGLGRAKTLVMIEALKQASATAKMPAVCAWTTSFLEGGRKLVLFAHHKAVVNGIADCIREAGYSVVTITGDTAPEDRQNNVDRFQNDPDVRLLVANIAAGGVGITLTAASDVAFAELPWRPGDLTQAEDRCHRIGQTETVTAWYLLAANTIEEKIAGMLDNKRAVVDETTDGTPGIAPNDSIVNALIEALEKEEQT